MAQRTPSPPATHTILDILQEKNPDITDEWAGGSYKNTRSATGSFDIVQFDDVHPSVQEWTDFNFEAIELAYGDILHQDIKHFDPAYQPVPKFVDTNLTTIIHKGSVNALGIRWSHLVVKIPLRAAAAHLPLPGGIQNPTLEYQQIQWTRPDTKAHVFLQPNWAIFENTLTISYREDKHKATPKRLVYAVGDSKLSQKWKSQWLAQNQAGVAAVRMDPGFEVNKPPPVLDLTGERKLPLEQLATYCRYGQTRYGFILTQTELVALRIRRIHPQTKGKHYAAVEYTSVPWHRKTKLTVNLAIWALGCMGMNNEHREMETADGKNLPLDRMARLTWWRHDPKANVYQNVISKRKIPGSEWKQDYGKFVHLTEQAGNSFTSAFETGHTSSSSSQPSTLSLPLRPGPNSGTKSTPPASAQPSIQAKRAVASATPSRAASTGTKPASAAAGPNPPSFGTKGPKPLVAATNVPKPLAATIKGPKPVSAPASTGPLAAAPVAIPATPPPSSRSAASLALREKECIINRTKYMATYSSNDKKWKVKINGKEYLIRYDKSSTVKVDGEVLDVCWVKS